VNDLSFVTKVIKGIQYDISVKDASNNYISTEGLTYIRIQNDYQDTGKVSLASRQRNRFNVWKIKKIPRNILQANKISRVRNDWHLVTLYYDNSSYFGLYPSITPAFSIGLSPPSFLVSKILPIKFLK